MIIIATIAAMAFGAAMTILVEPYWLALTLALIGGFIIGAIQVESK